MNNHKWINKENVLICIKCKEYKINLCIKLVYKIGNNKYDDICYTDDINEYLNKYFPCISDKEFSIREIIE